MEFRSKDLDGPGQPVCLSLTHAIDRYGNIDEVNVVFHHNSVTLHKVQSGKKNKRFTLNQEEMEVLLAGWQQYQQDLLMHKTAEEARIVAEEAAEKAQLETIIVEAKALAKSVHFDLEGLNVYVGRDGGEWHIRVQALGFENWINTINLKNAVQEALDYIKEHVEWAESRQWDGLWAEIVASYRRVFPLEPAKIVEARKLLAEANMQNWTITPGSDETWNFEGSIDGVGEILLSDDTPTQILTDIKAYLERQASHRLADAMKGAEQGEPAEIQEARTLLKDSLHLADWAQCSIYPGSEPDTWNFDNGLEGERHITLTDMHAEDMLECIKLYVSEPVEIQEARKLLTEAGVTGWTITPGSFVDNIWNFDGPFGETGEISMPDETPEQLLADVKEYLDRKKSDALLDAMEQEVF